MEDDTAARVRELGGLALIGLSLWLLLSLATFDRLPPEGATGVNLGGDLGFHMPNGVLIYAGLAGYLLALLDLAWGVVMVARHEIQILQFIQGMGVFASVIAVAFVLDLGFGPSTAERQAFFSQRDQLAQDGIFAALSNDLPYGPGGLVALEANPVLVQRFGAVGLWIVLLTLPIMSLRWRPRWLSLLPPSWPPPSPPPTSVRTAWASGCSFAVGRGSSEDAIGMWDFLRGADLAAAPASRGAHPARSPGSGGSELGHAQEGRAAPRPRRARRTSDDGSLRGEAGDGRERDEDGNSIDPSDLDEYEEEACEGRVGVRPEEEEADDAIVPAAKADEEDPPEPPLDFDQEASEKS